MATAGTAARLCSEAHAAKQAPAATAFPGPLPAPAIGRLEPAERERLLLLHLPQVRLVAETLRARLRFVLELDDLMSYGVIGLLRAIERYDPDRGVLLKTYAEHRIRGAMLDGVRAMDWMPRSARQKERRHQESMAQWEAAQARSAPLPGERMTARGRRRAPSLARPVPPRLGCVELINAGADLVHLEKISQRTGLRGLLGDVGDDPETGYQREEMRVRLLRAVSCLPQRHRVVIELHYQSEWSMKRIGQMLRVHESRVSQLHAAAIKRLRAALSPDCAHPGQKAGRTGRPALRDQRPAGKPSIRCQFSLI
ncbi:MAG: sigma-70 family RNA polymerase sigma factor [Terriglobia bacterium]